MPRSITLLCDIDDDLRARIEQAQRAANAAQAAVPDGYERFLRRRGGYLSGRASTVIEGNPLDERASQLAAFDGEGDSPAHIDLRNSIEACALALDWAQDLSFHLDQGAIRAFNSVLLRGLPGRAADNRGRYRLGGSLVMNTATRSIVYTTPPPAWLPELMDSLEARIAEWQRDDPPAVVAAKAHFSLVSVHPFEDGNGRTARLLADLILHRAGLTADGMAALSGAILSRRAEYYETLAAVQGAEFQCVVDVAPFVHFHTSALRDAIETLRSYVDALNRRRQTLQALQALQAADALSERRILGLLAMLQFSPLSASTWGELAECSPQTARTDLAALTADGFVERIGRGKATRYDLSAYTRDLLGAA